MALEKMDLVDLKCIFKFKNKFLLQYFISKFSNYFCFFQKIGLVSRKLHKGVVTPCTRFTLLKSTRTSF